MMCSSKSQVLAEPALFLAMGIAVLKDKYGRARGSSCVLNYQQHVTSTIDVIDCPLNGAFCFLAAQWIGLQLMEYLASRQW